MSTITPESGAKSPSPLAPGTTNATTRKLGKGKAPIGTRPGHAKKVDAKLETQKMAKRAYESRVETVDNPWAQVYFARLLKVEEISTILGNNVYKRLYSQLLQTAATDIQLMEVVAAVDFEHACFNSPENIYENNDSWMSDERGRCSVGKFSKFYTITNDSQLPAVGSYVQVEWTDFAPKTTGLILNFASDTGIPSGPASSPSALGAFTGGPVRNLGAAPMDNTPPVNESEFLTTNFKFKDFRCKDGTPVPDAYKERIRELAEQLEVPREAVGGKPIVVISGYRTKNYNDKLRERDGKPKGVYTSQHIKCRAVDIQIADMRPQEVHKRVLYLIETGKMKEGGVGIYDKWVHYDTRGKPARWDERTTKPAAFTSIKDGGRAPLALRKEEKEGTEDRDTFEPLNNPNR